MALYTAINRGIQTPPDTRRFASRILRGWPTWSGLRPDTPGHLKRPPLSASMVAADAGHFGGRSGHGQSRVVEGGVSRSRGFVLDGSPSDSGGSVETGGGCGRFPALTGGGPPRLPPRFGGSLDDTRAERATFSPFEAPRGPVSVASGGYFPPFAFPAFHAGLRYYVPLQTRANSGFREDMMPRFRP